MLTFEQMFGRLIAALVIGAIRGLERELVGKGAGIRTEMLVASGASMFAMIALALPYITAEGGMVPDVIARNSAFGVIANVVVGIGFLGAGIIVKLRDDHPHNVTTAADVWATAAIGILVGIGLIKFAFAAALLIVVILYSLRKMNVSGKLGERARMNNNGNTLH